MIASDSAGMTGIVWRRVDPAREAEAEALMHKAMLLSRTATGFLGSEIFPPIAGVQDAYVVLYRFNSSENLRRWLELPARHEILRQIEPLLLQPAFECFFAHRRFPAGTVSSVFSYRVRKEREEDFLDWRKRILEACRTFEGYLGTESFDTFDTSDPEIVVIVRFDTRAHLDAWLHSDIRGKFMKEVSAYTENYRIRRIGTGFEGWFEYSEEVKPPVAWRQGLIVLSGLFPVIMTLKSVLLPVFSFLPFPVAYLILLTIDVALLTYVIMPHYTRMMNFWLRPGPKFSWKSELSGWAILLGVIGLTLALTLMPVAHFRAFR